MRSRMIAAAALIIAAAAVIFAVRPFASTQHHPAVHASLAPSLASYLGVYEDGAPPAYQPITGFAGTVGRKPNIGAYFSGWAQPFDLAFAQMIRKRGVVPFVQIDPTDASVAAIAAGTYDEYLRAYAGRVRDFGHVGIEQCQCSAVVDQHDRTAALV